MDNKNKAAVELGKLGGLKGGNARAAALSAEERKNIAQQGASARWAKRDLQIFKDVINFYKGQKILIQTNGLTEIRTMYLITDWEAEIKVMADGEWDGLSLSEFKLILKPYERPYSYFRDVVDEIPGLIKNGYDLFGLIKKGFAVTEAQANDILNNINYGQ